MEIIQEIPSFALVQEHWSGRIEVFLKIELTALSYIERLHAASGSEQQKSKLQNETIGLFKTKMKIVQILNVNQKIVYFKENTFISKEINQKVAIKLSFPFSIPQLLPSSWFFRCNSYQTWQTYLKVSDIFSQLESLQIILSHSILSKRIQENLSDNILLMQLVVVLLTQVAALYCMDQEISLIVKLKYSA